MPSSGGTVVVKIGGSTLGARDTSLADCAALHAEGRRVAVVHGGGAAVTDWQRRLGVEAEWVDGLRQTTAEALEVVIAVLCGSINKRLVRELRALGAPAVGISGIDGGAIRSPESDRLGYVGEAPCCDPALPRALLDAGWLPVLAPAGVSDDDGTMLNINADSAAGAVAAALGASDLIFLTDVPGVLDGERGPIGRLDREREAELRQAGAIAGGMLPKLAAGRAAQCAGARVRIVDGRAGGAVRDAVAGGGAGTALI